MKLNIFFSKIISKISYFSNRVLNANITSIIAMNDQKDRVFESSKRLKTEDTNIASVNEEIGDKSLKTREKLRKWVLLLSYCGRDYYGMQRQKEDSDFPTIERDLFESLWKSGVINEEKYMNQHLTRFQRAARTDKGVSAIKQIVSILLPINFPELMPKVNQLLPKQIRIIDCIRVTKFFDAKNFCDGRTYSYLMPSYALCPIDQKTCESFRLEDKTLIEMNEILRTYLGTHNYHNFTANKKPTDASASRYIIDINCSEPFIMNDIEFVVIRVKGQSFMLHQIRKMIGLALAVSRGVTDKQTIIKAFGSKRIDIPKAPGLGLLLEEVHYDRYNVKYGGDGIHESIKWENHNEAVNEFKHSFIYPVIAETEKKEMQMFEWLQTLILHTYDEREQKANIPLDQQSEENVMDLKLKSPFLLAKRKADKEKLESDLSEDKCELQDVKQSN